MLVSFFESFKYIGHMLPVSFLRIFLGYYFLNTAINRVDGGYLDQPQLAAQINEWVPLSVAPEIIKEFLEGFVVTYWQFFAHFLTYGEYLLGIGLMIGFLVRPLCFLGLILVSFTLFINNPSDAFQFKLIVSTLITFLWLGAGRCMGIDYFFFKRHRGIWW